MATVRRIAGFGMVRKVVADTGFPSRERPIVKTLLHACRDRFLPIAEKFPSEGIRHRARRSLSRSTRILRSDSQREAIDQETASQIAAAACGIRIEEKGRRVIGRKIGFTNKHMQEKYGISEPIWGYMWDDSVRSLYHHGLARSSVVFLRDDIKSTRPKIEPEIVFGIGSLPRSDMTDRQLLDCVSWIALGFEVVHSVHYPRWQFTATDAIVAGGLHHALLLGQRMGRRNWEGREDAIIYELQNFEANLYRDQRLMASGLGSNVLGSPLNALRILCSSLERQSLHPPIQPREIISTGTLTDALGIRGKSDWRFETKGLTLPQTGVACKIQGHVPTF